MATIHANEIHRSCHTGPPWVRARMALMTWLIGLFRAKACSQSGIVEMGTNAELAKMSGNTQMNPAAWADSGSRTLMPMHAEIQQKLNPNRTARASRATQERKAAW